ncbi:MAG TPA: lysylphosphatidylglycerol synthase transmembrane domain-containing protein [Aggregatilineales bacterium]|nr:flippase-like domain-containing protein [Anaerolineales bacterium]HRE46846.1 lysylphosphatidylglycerol synthase transmembrane domain-containing protein [Aggregatilineales bacterium]
MKRLRLIIGIALLLLLIPLFAAPQFWATLAGVNVPLVIAALVLSAASVASKAWRWGVVLQWQGMTLPFRYLLSSYFVSMFFNNFLPSGLGGDVVRAYESARHTGRRAQSVTAVIVERGSGMIAVFAAGSLGAILVPNLPLGVILLAHGLFLGSLIAIAALWSAAMGRLLGWVERRSPTRLRRVWQKIIRLHEEFRAVRGAGSVLRAVMGQSLVTLTLTLAAVYALLRAFGDPTPLSAFAAAFSIITAIDVIPFSLNGIGVREGSYVFFLGLIGVGQSVALGVAVLVRLIVLIQALGGGIVFLARRETPLTPP